MKILITGATGLIGKELTKSLVMEKDVEINILTRNIERAKKTLPLPIDFFKWDLDTDYIDPNAFDNIDIIINLVGENIASKRWSKEQKDKLIESRTKPIDLILKNIRNLPQKIHFISASAVGVYGNRKEEKIFEDSELGDDFLANVCKKWEEKLHESSLNLNVNIMRIGLVLTKKGGALPKMLPAFRAGIAGRLGSGEQYMSWIHIDDLIQQFIYIIKNKPDEKIINAVSPRPVSNYVFTAILAKELRRPAIIPVPSFALKLLLGEMSNLLLTGQKVIPKYFLKRDFNFKYRSIKDAIREEVKELINGETLFEQFQWVPAPTPKVFEFFSDEYNLEKLTPNTLQFKVEGKNTESIQTGTLIDYKLKLHGVPLEWRTEILQFVKNKHFIDQQLKGPYKKWFHIHSFKPVKGGTLMIDQITYKPPFGLMGRLIAGRYIKKDVSKIFKFRREVIESLFKR